MTSSPVLDALIAVHVFGQIIYDPDWPCGSTPGCGDYEAALRKEDPADWHTDRRPVVAMWDEPVDGFMAVEPVAFYSSTLVDAYSILNQFAHMKVTLQMDPARSVHEHASCTIFDGFSAWYAFEATLSLAICAAALKAKGVRQEIAIK